MRGEKNERYNRETDEWLTTTTGAARRLMRNPKKSIMNPEDQ